jgi:TetR/AcrR family transcriptional regulator
MQQIAEAARIKKPTLYHHFRDKEDLFVAVMDIVFTRSREAIVAALVPGATLREQLHSVAVHVFATSRSNYGRLIVDLHEQVSESRRAELLRQRPPPWKLIQPAIASAIASGEVRPLDEELAGRLFFTTVWGHMWLARDGKFGETLDDDYAARLVDMLMDGMSACPSQPLKDQ